MERTWVVTLMVVLASGVLAGQATAASFDRLGDLPGGDFESGAYSVSADGSVVVGHGRLASDYEAFRWTAFGGMVGLGDLPGGSTRSHAYDVSDDGSVVVGYGNSVSGNEAYRWTQASGMVGLDDLPGGAFSSEAQGVSADGSVVVGRGSAATSFEAFRWTSGGGMVGLGGLPGGSSYSRADDVSSDGSVVIGTGKSAASSSNYEAFRWTQSGGMVGLGDLPGSIFNSHGNGVSADGSVVVGWSNSSSGGEAFRWTQAGGMVGLGDLPTGIFNSNASAVSADGSVVVGWGYTGSAGMEAFIWDEANGMRSIKDVLTGLGVDLTDWTLTQAEGVCSDGLTVAGHGTNPSGDTEAWLAYMSDTVYWRAESGGVWAELSNWTGPRLPTPDYKVTIAPNSWATVTGPTHATTIKALTIGGAGGNATLRTSGGGNLTVTEAVTIEANGTLDHDLGTFSAGSVVNYGNVQADAAMNVTGTFENNKYLYVNAGGTINTGGGLINRSSMMLSGGTISGAALTNDYGATLSAEGTVDADLNNNAQMLLAGLLHVTGKVTNFGEIGIHDGQNLLQDGGLNNYGTIELDGGAITGGGAVVNQAGGIIRGGSAISAPLTNSGLIHANGDSTLLITNMSGNNTAAGEMRVDDGAGINVVSSFTNYGAIVLGGGDDDGDPIYSNGGVGGGGSDIATFSGGSIHNSGTICGQGRVANDVSNYGTIRADADTLTLAGNVCNEASGIAEVLDGATLFVSQGITSNIGAVVLRGGTFDNNHQPIGNSGAGIITGHGTFRSGWLTNNNHIGVGGGDMDIVGNVTNNCVIGVESGCTVVFYNDVDGSGDFMGTGTVVFLSYVNPGLSPGEMTFAGDVRLGSAATLNMELAGTGQGSEYDAIDVAGDLALSGTLNVVLDGYNPQLDDTFDLLDWGSLTGEFDTVILPVLDPGLTWDDSALYTDGSNGGTITVVPEPASASLLLLGAVAMLRRRQRTR